MTSTNGGRSRKKSHDLSPREVQVLSLMVQGQIARQVAEALGITQRTVHAHSEAVVRKLGAINRANAVAIAVRDRIV
jgi:DNA-binding CsgD family transcriptional regulator